jgi:cytoskeleton protein RodZ
MSRRPQKVRLHSGRDQPRSPIDPFRPGSGAGFPVDEKVTPPLFLLQVNDLMSEAIGQQLRQAREERQISLEQAAQATHIRLRYLEALEAGDFAALPSEVQARGFLRSYASYLNLDANALLAAGQGEAVATPQPAPEPAQPQGSPEGSANQAFVEIGQKLKSQRELLGFSLDDVGRHTHLRLHYLSSLEAGDLDGLPSPVQGRGMLNNYAVFLGLDPEPLLLRFAEGLQARLAVKQAARAEKQPQPSRPELRSPTRLQRTISSELIIGAVLVIFLAASSIWVAIRIFSIQSGQQVAPTAPSIADVLLATATETLTSTPMPPTLTLPAAIVPENVQPTGTGAPFAVAGTPGSGVQVYVTARHRAWMRVLVDGEVEFDGRILPGSAYAFSGDERVELLTGDGDALQVFFNQLDLGPLGQPSEVVDLVFTLDGMQTPTPTITPSPTTTPRFLETPGVTPAP